MKIKFLSTSIRFIVWCLDKCRYSTTPNKTDDISLGEVILGIINIVVLLAYHILTVVCVWNGSINDAIALSCWSLSLGITFVEITCEFSKSKRQHRRRKRKRERIHTEVFLVPLTCIFTSLVAGLIFRFTNNNCIANFCMSIATIFTGGKLIINSFVNLCEAEYIY